MSTAAYHPRIEELLRHEGFLKKTLRALLASEDEVEDVVQETWKRVLERPGGQPLRPRSWLARVARNVVLSRSRSDRRRARREALSGQREGERTPAESAARVEGLQRVVAAILDLDEPYRSVVLLRYEQDLDVRAIARRLGRSAATVRSQLSRAHAILRTDLDREFGGRERWAALAGPLLVESGFGLLLAAGAVIVLAAGWVAASWLAVSQEPATPIAVGPLPPVEPIGSNPSPDAPREPLLPTAAAERRPQAPPAYPEAERYLPPAELLDRAHYVDYERATFSFEHGLRDDPGLAITRNDWDVSLERGKLHTRLVVDDRGFIADLGERAPAALDGVEVGRDDLGESAPVVQGHSYFVWTLDDDTDLACLVFVREHDPGKSCLLDWYATDGTGRAQGSLKEDGRGEPLVDLLVRLRREAIECQGTLRSPEVLLQARQGAAGGKRSRVFMDGDVERVDEQRTEPLDLLGAISMDEPARAHCSGGAVPYDQVFHVMQVLYEGRALGDSNGHGAFAVVVGGEELVRAATGDAPAAGAWTGDIPLVAGDEGRTYVEIANSSAGEARLLGYFAPRKGTRFERVNAGFFATVAPVPPAVTPLRSPGVVLQARAGAGGGNPNRVDMTGKTSLHVDRVESSPLDFTRAPATQDDSVVYCEGGQVPEGMVLVITRATWWGTSAGAPNGRGALKLVVAGEVLVDEVDGEEPHFGSWTGRLLVPRGEESRTYLEVADSSAGDARLTGCFEPAGR